MPKNSEHWSGLKLNTCPISTLAVASLASPILFNIDIPWWAWLCAVLNFIALIFVPTYLKKDDNQLGQPDQQLPTHTV